MSLAVVAGINTTLFTEDGRSVCKHLDDLFDLPEFENVDPAILSELKLSDVSALVLDADIRHLSSLRPQHPQGRLF